VTSLRQAWAEYWFGRESPETLGLARLLFLGALCLFYLPLDMSAWGAVDDAFWMPITLFRIVPVPRVDTATLEVLQLVFKLALCCGAIGLFTRSSCVVAAAIGLYLIGLPHNFGKTHHNDSVIVITLAILALSRSGDTWSVDAWWRRRRGQPAPVAAGHYRWPIRTVWLLLSMVFFSAGAFKLRNGGLEWIFSDNLAVMLRQNAYQVADADPLTTWGLWLAQHPALCVAAAFLTVLFEFAYPLALIDWRARIVFPLGMCGLLLGIRLLMGPTFGLFILCHLFWIPWDRVAAAVRGIASRRAAPMRGPTLAGGQGD
jgi:hypothetical protein